MTAPEPYDAETIEVGPAVIGPPVDPPEVKTTFADIVTRYDDRRPIVPASLRTKAGRHAIAQWGLALAAHSALYHLTRAPKYAAVAAWYAPIGVARAAWRAVRWAAAEEGNWHLRQEAATRGDASTWLALDARRQRQASWRWPVLLTLTATLVVALALLAIAAPAWAQWATAGAAWLLFARLGRPADRPILDRVTIAGRFIRLTAELTRAALVASGAGIKDPSAVRFNREIYRDGPGHTAEVTLPTGVIAMDVIDRRDYLAAGFQLPVSQVWPDPVPGAHPGVLAIWVSDKPVDRMRQPTSPLLDCGALDFWGPMPFGDDVRMRPISWRLDERNSLFGGMPGSGKTLAARNVALAAALDPLVQFAISELKGSGDFDPLERLCGERMYASGADERSKQRTMEILYWLDRECEVRGPLIRKWAAKGLNSQNKLNRAIAEADPRLRPILGIFDEIQELITDPILGKEATALLTSIVKRGRSLGIHLILATQRIDKQSVPKGISSNVSNRMALAVPSHVEVDLILGTGAYRNGARPTTFVPPATGDNPWAGWGYLAGRAQPIRASYVDNAAADDIVGRALALRRGQPAAEVGVQDRDVLDDVLRVFAHLGRPGLQWQKLAELLAEQQPDVYKGATGESVSALVRAAGVPSVDVNADGRVLKGCRRAEVEAAVQKRAIGG